MCDDFEATTQSRCSSTCNVGDEVQCPESNAWCKGNECCPNGSICPSAAPNFGACERAKAEDCTVDSAPIPSPPPPSGMGFCGVASGTPNKNEETWGPLFNSASINWFWNWDIQARSTDYVPEGWYFVPNLWGTGSFTVGSGVTAHDGPGASTYIVKDIVLGWNEPDIVGLCIDQPEIMSPSDGWCPVAGSMGWWFPELVNNSVLLMDDWYQQHDDSRSKGYSVASPQVAAFTDERWLKPFVRASCNAGRCPQMLAWHFYSGGCHDDDSYLEEFSDRLDDTLALMQEFPSIDGTMITEAGTLALEFDGSEPAATCPDSVLVTVMHKMFAIMRQPKYYINGRHIVRHFSWFSQDGTGATYNLSLVDPSTGEMRPLGYAYVEECRAMMASLEIPLNTSTLVV